MLTPPANWFRTGLTEQSRRVIADLRNDHSDVDFSIPIISDIIGDVDVDEEGWEDIPSGDRAEADPVVHALRDLIDPRHVIFDFHESQMLIVPQAPIPEAP